MKTTDHMAHAPVDPVSRIVIPVGGASGEFLAQHQALEFAAALDVPVYAIHVQADPSRRGDPFSFIEETAPRLGVTLDTRVVAGGDPAQVILAELDALDLVVVGTQKLGTRFHLGSVAEALIREAPCMVQVIRLGG